MQLLDACNWRGYQKLSCIEKVPLGRSWKEKFVVGKGLSGLYNRHKRTNRKAASRAYSMYNLVERGFAELWFC